MESRPDPELLTSEEVASLLRVHPKHVYRLLKKGLPARRVGGKWLYSREDVLKWAERRPSGAQPPEAEPTPAAAEPEPALAPPLLAANGDLAVEMLLGRLQGAGGSLLGFVQTDGAGGLRLISRGQVLAAGWHGPSPRSNGRLARVHLVHREVGLARRAAQERRGLDELAGMRLASRPSSAGIRAHLDKGLRELGLDPELIHQRAALLSSHREVACAVARGEADFGLLTRAWALRLGLAFEPLGWEDYGILVSARSLGDERVVRLCETVQSRAYREALEELPGYDARATGNIRFDAEARAAR